MSKALLALIVVIILGTAYFLLAKDTSAPDPSLVTIPETVVENSLNFVLSEQNASGESGIATVVEQDGTLVVTLDMTGAPEGISQPAHIHSGTCAEIGAVVYPLEFPLNGSSVTTIPTTLSDLATQVPLALNVHKSTTEASVYVSCGDLPLQPATPADITPATY